MSIIIKNYLQAALLIKLAKLTDEQYAKTIRNTRLMMRLDEADLLNDFYKAMPLVKEEDILSRLQNIDKQKTLKEVYEQIDKDKRLRTFLDMHGNDKLDEQILSSFNEDYLGKDHRFTVLNNDNVDIINKYCSNKKISDLIIDYLSIANSRTSPIKDFITHYVSFIRNKRFMIKQVVSDIINITNYILSSESVQTSIDVNFIQAARLREGDQFDFILDPDPKFDKLQTETRRLSPDTIERSYVPAEPTLGPEDLTKK